MSCSENPACRSASGARNWRRGVCMADAEYHFDTLKIMVAYDPNEHNQAGCSRRFIRP
ncbi:hypothetical protein [Treponema endosymbiont of Eucomonympha sp.]|uniref:hypothetical protein n=1 Tax=Treponema endosymbiont of Eucomonympha sp. TaxID=1580831 RepID=UPI001EE7361C|nr:hypothetical protein [Treponema endosymbiont of Eucomonympha sp.]